MKNSFEVPLWLSALLRMTKPAAPPEKPYRLFSTPAIWFVRPELRNPPIDEDLSPAIPD